MNNTNTDLELQYTILLTPDGTTLKIVETTDAYSTTNVGGYGTVNPVVGDVTDVALEIVSDGSAYTFASADVPDLPDDAAENVTVITSDQLGQDTGVQLPDGILTLTFTYSGTFNSVPFIAENTIYKGIAPSLECCYAKLITKVSTGNCGCSSQEEGYKTAMKLRTTIDAFYQAATCNDTDRAQELLAQGQFICEDCDCGC